MSCRLIVWKKRTSARSGRPPIWFAPGSYQVHWTALSVDTHVTEGQFTFTVEGR